METIPYINAYAAIGILVVWCVLAVLALFAWHFGNLVWRRVTRVYHITVIAYWLQRLEKAGGVSSKSRKPRTRDEPHREARRDRANLRLSGVRE